MCGIIAYIGSRGLFPLLIQGLKRLEYRGYDSAGLAYFDAGEALCSHKKQGRVEVLEEGIGDLSLMEGVSIGMGHTRWATHGAPSDRNAHPHFSASGKLALVHNGIIENYSSLRTELMEEGYGFVSETDTEVLATFIESVWTKEGCSLEEALRLALTKVVGAYALVILSGEDLSMMVAARKGSPLLVGVREEGGEYFFASDATPVVEYTDKVIYLEEESIAVIRGGKLSLKDLSSIERVPYIEKIELKLEEIEKGGYAHFMLKEIMSQPSSVVDSMRGRVHAQHRRLVLGGLRNHVDTLSRAQRIIIIGCGTSWHAGLIGEYLLEDLCRIPVEVEYASEFRYRNPVITHQDVVLAISQSGETADVLAAVDIAKQRGATLLGVVNVVGSTIARTTQAGVYLHAGPEVGVASTKAFVSQLIVITMIALQVAMRRKTISKDRYAQLLQGLETLPMKIQQVVAQHKKIREIALCYEGARNFLYLGRGYNFPVALEGALKLKEISYIHAEGYPAAEMKHGPIALIDEEMPVVFIATRDSSYKKIISNIEEIKSRKGRIVAIVTEKEEQIVRLADHVIEIPEIDPLLSPILSVIPLQLLAYYMAVSRGCDVDRPRNLAKSVTVE